MEEENKNNKTKSKYNIETSFSFDLNEKINSLKELYDEKINNIKEKIEKIENKELKNQDRDFQYRVIFITALITLITTLFIQFLIKKYY